MIQYDPIWSNMTNIFQTGWNHQLESYPPGFILMGLSTINGIIKEKTVKQLTHPVGALSKGIGTQSIPTSYSYI